jgi:hypothetical protein
MDPLGSLNNFQIERYLKGKKQFGGVFSNDELQNPDPNKIYILNLQNRNEGGSHWCLLHNHNYYDSYSAPPTQAIQPYVKHYNGFEFQSLRQESCGYYTLYIADNIIAKRHPTNGLKDNEPRQNENVLKKYFLSHSKSPTL